MNLPQILSILILIATTVFQSPADAGLTKHFEGNGVAFDYPANWTLTETSAEDVKTVVITSKGGAARITVHLRNIRGCDFQSETKKIEDALIKNLAAELKIGEPPNTSPVVTQVGKIGVQGRRLVAMRDSPITGDVYSFRMNWRLINLVFVRDDKDERATEAWETIRTNFRVGTIAVAAMDPTQRENVPLISGPSIGAGVLNGRALSLPQPSYPAIARAAHVSGTVTVQVVIDESGAVSSAHAIDGHPLLQGACVDAARRAQFTPTKLCGEPVKVTGVITYTFVAR